MTKNRSVHLVHEDFESFFNTAAASVVVMRKFLHRLAAAFAQFCPHPRLLELRQVFDEYLAL